MRKIFRLAYIMFAFLMSCANSKKITKQGDITIIDEGYITVVGVAKEDSKGGALIEKDPDHRYFIKDLSAWPKNAYGKKIKASGRCITVDQRKLMKKNPYRQGYAIKRTLEDIKWEVVE